MNMNKSLKKKLHRTMTAVFVVRKQNKNPTNEFPYMFANKVWKDKQTKVFPVVISGKKNAIFTFYLHYYLIFKNQKTLITCVI